MADVRPLQVRPSSLRRAIAPAKRPRRLYEVATAVSPKKRKKVVSEQAEGRQISGPPKLHPRGRVITAESSSATTPDFEPQGDPWNVRTSHGTHAPGGGYFAARC